MEDPGNLSWDLSAKEYGHYLKAGVVQGTPPLALPAPTPTQGALEDEAEIISAGMPVLPKAAPPAPAPGRFHAPAALALPAPTPTQGALEDDEDEPEIISASVRDAVFAAELRPSQKGVGAPRSL